MDEELNKIVDTYYEDAPIIDTNEDSLDIQRGRDKAY